MYLHAYAFALFVLMFCFIDRAEYDTDKEVSGYNREKNVIWYTCRCKCKFVWHFKSSSH